MAEIEQTELEQLWNKDFESLLADAYSELGLRSVRGEDRFSALGRWLGEQPDAFRLAICRTWRSVESDSIERAEGVALIADAVAGATGRVAAYSFCVFALKYFASRICAEHTAPP